MGKAERRTGGAIEAGLVGNDPLLTAQRIVLRAWPSSWSNGKWIIEAYAAEDCPVELAVLPASSPCGSAEADDLTKLLLTERGARLFSTGKRVFNGTLVAQTLRQRLQAESYFAAFKQTSHTLEGLKESAAKETAARIAEWKKRIEALSHE